MSIENLISYQFIFFYFFLFLALLAISKYYKVKSLWLRLITLLIILFILINPLKNGTKTDYHKDTVLLVSDFSRSIIETKKLEQVKNIQENFLKELKNFKDVEIININFNENDKNKINKTDEKGTLIFREIYNKLDYIQKNRVSGIIIITDGQIHDLKSFKSLLNDIPIHFIIVGNKNEKDRILTTSNVPNYVLMGNSVDFELEIIDNFNDTRVNVTFSINGNIIQSKLLLPNKIHSISLPLTNAGKALLEIRVEDDINEITSLNNLQTYEINGIYDRLRVMLISGEPNMGLRSLRNILNSDPAVELLHFTILRPPSKRDLTPVKELSLIPFPTQELFAADISKFSLIIFDQYSLKGILPPKYLNNITRFVINGGALLDIAGKDYTKDISLINSPIKQILPTRPLKMNTALYFKPKLTKLGERHPITNNIGEKFKNNNWGNWSRYTKSKVISGKTLLHFNNDPLLVIDSIGEGRVAQILSDQSWIWKKSEKEKGPLVKLLRNTIHWLLKTPNMEEDFVSISKDNDKIKIKLNSINPGNLEAEVIAPNNSKKNIILKDNKRGSIEGTFYSNGLGKYSIKYNNKIKHFFIGDINNKELIDVRSTDKNIINYFKDINNENQKTSLYWASEGLPEIIKIYNKNYFKGKNWIGIIERKVLKEDNFSKKSFLSWYLLLFSLVMVLLFSWYKERKN